MLACVRHGVDFVLAGSIRDDGPLPEVITDTLEAQQAMREKITGVTTALMMGTMLHSMAVANLLPADGENILRGYQPGGGQQTDRARVISIARPGFRCGAVPARARWFVVAA